MKPLPHLAVIKIEGSHKEQLKTGSWKQKRSPGENESLSLPVRTPPSVPLRSQVLTPPQTPLQTH